MGKTHIYFVPGLAANKKIFEFISLPEDLYELHFIEWLIPTSVEEPIENYAKRMCNEITHANPVLVGVSFGGIVVQEMSKIIQPQKTIIISSIKTKNELPNRLKLAQKTKAYKLFPSKVIENIENYEAYFFTDFLKKRSELYKTYLSVRNATYLQWAIHNVLNWHQEIPMKGIIHIHGNKDEIFPLKNIQNTIEVNNGSHVMILDKAKTISKILTEQCKF